MSNTVNQKIKTNPKGRFWLLRRFCYNFIDEIVFVAYNIYGDKYYLKCLSLLDMRLIKIQVQMFVVTRYTTNKRSSSNFSDDNIGLFLVSKSFFCYNFVNKNQINLYNNHITRGN